MKGKILVRVSAELIAKLREANPHLQGVSATDLVNIILRRNLQYGKKA